MQKLIIAATFIVTIGAIVMSGSLGAGHQFPTTKAASATIDPTALTLAAKDLPVVQVNEPF
jgi:hypothetical protein